MTTVELPGNYEKIEEYPNGVSISHVTGEGMGDHYTVAVPVSNVTGFLPMIRVETEDAARLLADVWTVVGGFTISDVGDAGVPPEVARESSRVVVSYLMTQSYDIEDLMEMFDIKRETIHSFTSRVRADARELREASE